MANVYILVKSEIYIILQVLFFFFFLATLHHMKDLQWLGIEPMPPEFKEQRFIQGSLRFFSIMVFTGYWI